MPKEKPQKMEVLKASGKREPFSEEKVRISLKRIGASREMADEIIDLLKPELYDGITTHEIYQRVFEHLKERGTHLASRYNLRRAVMNLGPTGYPFEEFFAKILEQEGFQTEVGQQVKGRCTRHEVDIVAEKDGKKYMIETKFHNRVGIKTDTKVALYVYGRFLDVSTGDGFDEGWLVTNTKMTRDAVAYCNCVGLKAISWNYPEDFSLRQLLEKSRMHPVTALTSLSNGDKERILGQGVIFCRELLKNLDLLPKNKRAVIESEIRKLCE